MRIVPIILMWVGIFFAVTLSDSVQTAILRIVGVLILAWLALRIKMFKS